jgi:hypothetical protein
MDDIFLPGLPVDLIRAAYAAAPGNEIDSGKLESPESSAALVANTFGLFLSEPEALPPLSGSENCGWPALSVRLEAVVRFPWKGGRHPCLDVLIETEKCLIGIESKRYEPFRSKSKAVFSEAYWRPVWGDAMAGYEHVRDDLRDENTTFMHLDAAQLIKHAFGLRTEVHRNKDFPGKQAVLLYLYAEPTQWPDGRLISDDDIDRHRSEISRFSEIVADDEVVFRSCSYGELLTQWDQASNQAIRRHSQAIKERFSP